MCNREGDITLRYSIPTNLSVFSKCLRATIFLVTGVTCLLLANRQAVAETYNSPASENSVISEAQPDENLMIRPFSEGESALTNLLIATSTDQEYIIFKFDFSEVPANATITTPGVFNWATWYTHAATGDPLGQTQFGEFEFHEITAGDAGWEGNQFSSGVSTGAVTFNNLNGTFVNLPGVSEIDTGEGEPLVPGLLVGDGVSGNRQSLGGIPIATLERLRSGQSVGLAMASLSSTNMSIHSKDSFLSDQDKDPRLVFDWTTDVVFDPADFDEDGDVDAADLATWQTSFGSDNGADADLDGDSDGADFLVWQQSNSGALVGIANVPEPTTALLFGLASSILAMSNLRRRAVRS